MKSRFAGRDRTDLISSEAQAEDFIRAQLGFHRAKHDFIYIYFDLCYNKLKEVIVMAGNKLADMSTEFAE